MSRRGNETRTEVEQTKNWRLGSSANDDNDTIDQRNEYEFEVETWVGTRVVEQGPGVRRRRQQGKGDEESQLETGTKGDLPFASIGGYSNKWASASVRKWACSSCFIFGNPRPAISSNLRASGTIDASVHEVHATGTAICIGRNELKLLGPLLPRIH